MNSEANDATYTCGRCGLRWKGKRTRQPVGCPRCRNYCTIGVDSETARYFADRQRVTRGTES
jgi:predicted Zn-ribbon and HTH transcriptional regulator